MQSVIEDVRDRANTRRFIRLTEDLKLAIDQVHIKHLEDADNTSKSAIAQANFAMDDPHGDTKLVEYMKAIIRASARDQSIHLTLLEDLANVIAEAYRSTLDSNSTSFLLDDYRTRIGYSKDRLATSSVDADKARKDHRQLIENYISRIEALMKARDRTEHEMLDLRRFHQELTAKLDGKSHGKERGRGT